MRVVALLAIRAYRRWLSPRKGFRCAWAAASGRGSCSSVGLTVFRRAGWRRGFALMRRQFDRCAIAAAQRHDGGVYKRLRPVAAQRGDCDCGGCDLAGNCFDGAGCEVAECLSDSCPCDCGVGRDKTAEAARKRAAERRARREDRRRAHA